jgi:hypothetical protein
MIQPSQTYCFATDLAIRAVQLIVQPSCRISLGSKGNSLIGSKEPLFRLCLVTVDETAVDRQMIGKQSSQAFDVVTPVSVQLACYAKPSH